MTDQNPVVQRDPSQATFDQMMALEGHGPDTFVGIGPSYPWGGLYGGQIVAQALRAAGLTVDDAFAPHSLHAYFIRRGDAAEPIRFEVDRIRNGRSFCTRRVVARQSIGAILNLAASFQVHEEDVDVPGAVLPPEAGSPGDQVSDTWSHVFDRSMASEWRGSSGDGMARAWMRMSNPVEDSPLVRACALAYMSDDLPTEAVIADHPDRALLADADGDFEGTFMTASLDHAMWFHRPIDPAEWHLHDLRSNGLMGARGIAVGDIVSADGVHAASVTQEVLLRRVRPR